MTETGLTQLLERIRTLRVGVVGDFCLDAYWFMDASRSEASLETGLATQPVREHRCSLGGAGNVIHNLTALGCGEVQAFGVVGEDPWGHELARLLREVGARTDGLLIQPQDWNTVAYVKPHVKDAEQSRFDFGGFNRLSVATADRLIAALAERLPELDALIVNEQVREGLHTPHLRGRLQELIRRCPDKLVLVDSRHYSEAYAGACLKINDHEAARLCGVQRAPEALVLKSEAEHAARTLYATMRRPVFVTRGRRGCLVVDADGVHEIPAIQVLGRIDTVGAGDSTLAGLAAALACGQSPAEAATFGTFVATVTIQKLRQTGTASPAEVLAVGRDPDFIYRPELAEDPRQARHLPGTEIEVVSDVRPGLRITHAIFDHDGTLSTLRQGWEAVMEPVMVRAVLGADFERADESVYHEAVREVREYIDKTTGVQTIAQMQGLVDLVKQYGRVPPGEILDAAGYKAVYLAALMAMVRDRTARLARGELAVEDFTIKNAGGLLRRLHQAGVKLYLASGTDQADVESEARALGYAELFTGGIHGSIGDVTHEAKRVVLDRLLHDIGRDGLARLVMFGDGPVEIRETHKRGGYAIGLASDEVRRYGLSPAKRTRLIRAGADLILPDFSQLERLLEILL